MLSWNIEIFLPIFFSACSMFKGRKKIPRMRARTNGYLHIGKQQRPNNEAS